MHHASIIVITTWGLKNAPYLFHMWAVIKNSASSLAQHKNVTPLSSCHLYYFYIGKGPGFILYETVVHYSSKTVIATLGIVIIADEFII